MISNIYKKLILASCVTLSANTMAGSGQNSRSYPVQDIYPLQQTRSYSPINFLTWALYAKVDTLQADIDVNTLTIQDNTALIFDLEEKFDDISFRDSTLVRLAVDCVTDASALLTAYAENIDAKALVFTIEGACYGDFQSISPYLPDLSISSTTGASIIPNPDTGKVALVADGNEVSLNDINVIAGENDSNIIKASNNSTLNVSNITIDAAVGNDFAVRFEKSSSGEFDNVIINGNDVLRRGITVTSTSVLSVRGLMVTGTVEDSLNLTEGSTFDMSDHIELSQRTTAYQSRFRANSQSSIYVNGLYLHTGSSFYMSSDSILESNDRVSVQDGSSFRSRKVTINNEDLYVENGSSFRSRDSQAYLMINGGRLRVRYNSHAFLSEGEIFADDNYAMDITNGSNVSVNSTDDTLPLYVNGSTTVENSSLEGEGIVFNDLLVLKYSSTAVFSRDVELFNGYVEEINSHVYFE